MSRYALAAVIALGAGCGNAAKPPVSATPAATPAPLISFPAEDSGSLGCGKYKVAWNNPDRADGGENAPPAVLTVEDAKGGSVLKVELREPFERVVPEWCGDAVADGRVIFGYSTFSGGAHCCVKFYAFALDGKKTLLEADMGNAGAPAPKQLEPGGAYELTGFSDVFAYFDELPYAASPFIPLVFAYDGSRYQEATKRFGDFVREDLDKALEELEPGEAEKTFALQALADYVLLGEFDKGLADLRGRVSADTKAWLDRYAAEVRAQLEGAKES